MKVKIRPLDPTAQLPRYATDGSGCFDLFPLEGGQITFTRVFRTGLAFEIPSGFVMLIFSRSGHGFKSDTRLSNCVGVIDSDYRGEVMVKLKADGSINLAVRRDDAIAQAMIIPVSRIEFEVVNELSTTERGAGGFGSTDKLSDREWAAKPANLREGSTVRVDGVGEL